MAIASVPQKNNSDYLLQVVNSLDAVNFPSERQYVFFNRIQNHTHLRWDKAHMKHSR
jgi:hypothetical protein